MYKATDFQTGERIYLENIKGERLYGVVTGTFKGRVNIKLDSGSRAFLSPRFLHKVVA